MRSDASPREQATAVPRLLDRALPERDGLLARVRRSSLRAAGRARTLGRPVLAWVAAEAPPRDVLTVFNRCGAAECDRVLWHSQAERFGLAGVGTAWRLDAGGRGRFRSAAAAWRAVVDDARAAGSVSGGGAAGPIAFGGFAFAPGGPRDPGWDDYPVGMLVVPRVTVMARGDACRLALAAMVPPDGNVDAAVGEVDASLRRWEAAVAGPQAARGDGRTPPSPARVVEECPSGDTWRALVAAATRAMRGASLRKVVLARGVHVADLRIGPAEALSRLCRDYAECTVFAVGRGHRCFLGATPERLVGLQEGIVRVTALAGSAPRGGSGEDDDRLGRGLLDSAKERAEHAMVVEALQDALAPLCRTLSRSSDPVLRKLRNVQHLATPMTGVLDGRREVLELVERLHPTPAVGGTPRREALRWIADHEGWNRGWYAGPVGWVDGAGGGEFAVAIRSALVLGTDARIFAGCGIVASSDPDREYAESCLKLEPLLSALGAVEGPA